MTRLFHWPTLAVILGLICAAVGVQGVARAASGANCRGYYRTQSQGSNVVTLHDCGTSCPPGRVCLLRNVGPIVLGGQNFPQWYTCACLLHTTIVMPDGSVQDVYSDPQYDTLGGSISCDAYSFRDAQGAITQGGCAGACVAPQTCKKEFMFNDPVTGEPQYKCTCQ